MKNPKPTSEYWTKKDAESIFIFDSIDGADKREYNKKYFIKTKKKK